MSNRSLFSHRDASTLFLIMAPLPIIPLELSIVTVLAAVTTNQACVCFYKGEQYSVLLVGKRIDIASGCRKLNNARFAALTGG